MNSLVRKRNDGTATGTESETRQFRNPLIKDIRKTPILYIMIGFVVLWTIVFHFIPIYGITIAFKRYTFIDGFFGGEWVGLRYIKDFLQDPHLFRLIRNTLLLGFYTLVFGFPAPILFALLLNEIRSRGYKKFIQTITYLPHFVATVTVVGLMYKFLGFDGFATRLILSISGKSVNWFGEPSWFRPLYVGSGVWQSFGWGSIIYLANMAQINPALYESASIDGAGRWRQALHITIPGILPTVVVLFILSTRQVVMVGFEKAFLMQHPGIYETADVIATYIYRRGIMGGDYSYGTAIGLLNSLVAFIIVIAVNRAARIVHGEGLW